MSWQVSLYENERLLQVDRFQNGCETNRKGEVFARVEVSYNFSPFYYQAFDKKLGLMWLHGKQANTCVRKLGRAVKKLGTERTDNPRESAAENAGYLLALLLKWAKEHPKAILEVI